MKRQQEVGKRTSTHLRMRTLLAQNPEDDRDAPPDSRLGKGEGGGVVRSAAVLAAC